MTRPQRGLAADFRPPLSGEGRGGLDPLSGARPCSGLRMLFWCRGGRRVGQDTFNACSSFLLLAMLLVAILWPGFSLFPPRLLVPDFL